jgi:hypothetical protein
MIQKNGGCKYINCAKCHYEFCWYCLGRMTGYCHSDAWRWCPFRYFATVGSMIFFTVLLNFKLSYTSSKISIIWNALLYNIGALLYIDLFIVSFYTFKVIYTYYDGFLKRYGYSRFPCSKKLLGLLLYVFGNILLAMSVVGTLLNLFRTSFGHRALIMIPA